MNGEQKDHILFVEDEAALGLIVTDSLQSRGYRVTHVKDVASAREALRQEAPDILVLDVMLPDGDGFSFAKEIRQRDTSTPIIFLTARSATSDVVTGFELGGNDYLKKPFSVEELIVRIRALLKTRQREAEAALQPCTIGAYDFDPVRQLLQHPEQPPRQLTHRESAILHELIQHKNRLMERNPVLKALWGDDSYFNARSMDVFISKLRKYLSADPRLQIVNVRGQGYKLIVHDAP